MRRRLFQAAATCVLIASALPADTASAAPLPEHPTTSPPVLYVNATYIDPGLTIDDTLRALQIARDEADRVTAPIILEPAETLPVVLWPTDDGLYRLRMCESTDRYGVNTGNGYFGAYQFDRTTWNGVAARWKPWLIGVRPDLASPADQDAMVRALWSERGRNPWPVCGYRV